MHACSSSLSQKNLRMTGILVNELSDLTQHSLRRNARFNEDNDQIME